jgi:hypothetical protein
VVIKLAVCALVANELLTAFNTYEAVCAVTIYDEVMALLDHDAVPCKDAVTPAVTVNDPVTFELPCEKYPFFIMNSFAIPFPYPSMV